MFALVVAISARALAQAGVDVEAGAQGEVGGDATSASAQADSAAQSEPPAAGPAASEVAEAESDEAAWDLTHRAYNTLEGSSGGFRLIDPGMGMQGAVRVQLALDSYSGDSFLYDSDEVEQNRQFISVSWTALDLLEVFASIQNRATIADLPRQNSLHALGDLTFGFKLRAEPSPMWRIGGGLRLSLLNDIGEQETMLDATNIGLTGAVALDLQRQASPIPLIFRLNLDYLFDNSAKVLDDIEELRFRNLEDPADVRANEVRNLVTRVERFGLGVNRVDMFTLALGLEVPLQVGTTFLHPLLEWRLGIPVNRQGYDCAFFSSDDERGSNAPGADDTCLDDAGFDAYPMELTVGARFVPPVRGLTVALGADFGLNGTDTFVRELAAVAPFRLLLALGYDYDARPQPKPPAPPPAPPPPPAPAPKGRLIGRVVDQANNGPIANVVAFAGSTMSPVATDVSGQFVSYELEPGEVELDLSHPDYEPRRCGAVVPEAGGEIQVTCSLAALPTTGSVKGTLRDMYGAAVSGVRVQLVGPSTQTAASDVAGDFTGSQLAPGDYTARTESDAYLTRVLRFSVQPRQETRLDIALVPRPARSGIELRNGQVRARALKFIAGSTELDASSAMAVAEVADLLLREPSLRRLRIQGDGGELALTRALTIKQRLVDAGVPDTRLEAVTEPGSRVTLTIVE